MSLDIDLVRFMSNRVRDGTKSKNKKKTDKYLRIDSVSGGTGASHQ